MYSIQYMVGLSNAASDGVAALGCPLVGEDIRGDKLV